MMLESTPMLPQVAAASPPSVSWFSPGGCVVQRDAVVEVSVGGLLVGCYGKDETGARNAVLVGLAADPRMHLGHLARAFGLSEERLRIIRRQHEREGLVAIVTPRPHGGGTASKITPMLRRKLDALFAEGKSVSAAHASLGKKYDVSRATVGVARKEWAALMRPEAERARPAAPLAGQPELPLAECAPTTAATQSAPTETALTESTSAPMEVAPTETAPMKVAPTETAPSSPTAATESSSSEVTMTDDGEPQSCASMQHAGSWLLLGLLDRYGLYRLADEVCAKHGLVPPEMRIALDAFAAALALGQGCVEGVRRLATPTAPALLRAPRCPSGDWVRHALHAFADVGAARLHLGMAGRYLEASRGDDGPAVFYVDNHLRPYTGKQVIRRGWRMQDKRVLPGTTDVYVHDEDGRPTLRAVSPSHASLTEMLLEIADLLRAGLGEEQRILLAFDRGGAFPETLAALREESYEFVTYERRPFRLLRPSEFTHEMEFQVGQEKPERLAFEEFYVPLGRKRGDVRRIAIRMPDERQVNLLAIGATPAERLIEIQRRRWRQENGLKHGVERWRINHLDGRRTEAYAPETVVPNPARRRLDHALRLACIDEGLARNQLAKLEHDDAKRERAEAALAEAMAMQRELLARRASTPAKAPLADTELAGKLVYHTGAYKTVLDTVRIAAANAEADLAEWLAPHLPRAAEAKKTISNLLVAPGRVRVGSRTITVALAPAGTGPEQRAFAELFRTINAANLRLPGDAHRRLLRFGSQPG
jgi:transposase-like protein